MAASRAWQAYRMAYRAKEMKTIADWIMTNQSGSVIGLAGAGRSNFIGFLCHRPDALQTYLPQAYRTVLISVDLNDLPAYDPSTLYRVILRSFYEVRANVPLDLQQTIVDLYFENRAVRDPFLSQSALRELMLLLQAQQIQVVLVLDHFDDFCQLATPQMLNTLRSLRDSFKNALSYIVGLRQEIAYLPDTASLGHLYSLLDRYTCWVGPMAEADARQLINQEINRVSPISEDEIVSLLTLTGGHAALLQAACHWWLSTDDKPSPAQWLDRLLAESQVQYRLQAIWDRLTQQDQRILSEMQKLQAETNLLYVQKGEQINLRRQKSLDKQYRAFGEQHRSGLNRLLAMGICQQYKDRWQLVGSLLAAYIAQAEDQGRGKVWLDEKTGQLYQDKSLLSDLSPLATSVLRFLVENPRARHTKTDLIFNTWPDELRQEGVTDDSLYQIIMELRKKIEPNPGRPRYLVTRRGKPEGGYQFFPEGKPV